MEGWQIEIMWLLPFVSDEKEVKYPAEPSASEQQAILLG
jgi:hypothetical protein